MKDQNELIIEINATDWDEEYQLTEREIHNEDDLVKYAKQGVKPMELARNVIVARERQLTEEDILKSNKITLNIGGSLQINRIYARRCKKHNLENGNTIEVRELVCQNGDEDPKVVDSNSSVGCDRAISYLHSTTLGHIRNRIDIIALNLGVEGVRENIALLIDEIKEMEADVIGELE